MLPCSESSPVQSFASGDCFASATYLVPLCPYLQEYMWFFLTLLLKKPLQPSQLEAP